MADNFISCRRAARLRHLSIFSFLFPFFALVIRRIPT